MAAKDLDNNVALLRRAVAEKSVTLIGRLVRRTAHVRRRLTVDELRQAVDTHASAESSRLLAYIAFLPNEKSSKTEEDAMETDETPKIAPQDTKAEETGETQDKLFPEVVIYLANIVSSSLLKHKLYEKAAEFTAAMVLYSEQFNRRTMDLLVGKLYMQYSTSFERIGRLDHIRRPLLRAFRTACLQHNDMGKATLLNLLTRNFLHYNLYGRAASLISKTEPFPEVSNNQLVRHLYYNGKIKAVGLQYSDAFKMLSQALRKVPQNTALAFRVQVQKLAVLVQLLTGDLPERSIFNQPELQAELAAYLSLTQAIRIGDVGEFEKVLVQHGDIFAADGTHSFVLRLRNNVLKTGLRRISISYSRISFKDIAAKLQLGSAQDAEFVCAKAIRDGVVDAVLDHKLGYMRSKEIVDTYSTTAPRKALHLRTCFCLDIHNEAVKAMRYPPDAFLRKPGTDEDAVKDEKLKDEIKEKSAKAEDEREKRNKKEKEKK